MAVEPLAAELAAIREDLELTSKLERTGGYMQPTMALKHGTVLLAAVERVLALAAAWESKAGGLNDRASELYAVDPHATGVVLKRARSAQYEECARQLEQALAAELIPGQLTTEEARNGA